MNKYEQNEYEAVRDWEQKEPSVVENAVGFVFKPLSWLVEKVVPQKAIEGALVAFDKVAEFLTDTGDVIRDGSVSKVEELQVKGLKLSDELANSVHNWALAIAGTEGAATGATGLPGLIVDVPALITMSLRVIHKIGVCYGFEVRNEVDRNFVLGVLSAASANTMKEKMSALVLLQKINVFVAKTAWNVMAKNKTCIAAAIIAIKNLAKQLGINLTKRKVAQAIPVIGGTVGAVVNVAFINDVAWAARRMYQERWLMLNKRIEPSANSFRHDK